MKYISFSLKEIYLQECIILTIYSEIVKFSYTGTTSFHLSLFISLVFIMKFKFKFRVQKTCELHFG